MLHVLVSLLPWHVTPRPPPFKRRGRPILQVLAHALPGRSQEMQQQRLKKANRMDMTVMEAKLLSAVLAQLQGQLKSLPHLAAACKKVFSCLLPHGFTGLWFLCMVVCMFASCAWGVGISLKI